MEFKGTLTKGSSKEFKSPGEGQHIMGLVSIKDCIKKFKDEQVPGVQFLFKSVTDPDAVVCHRVSNSLNPKSNLFKTLRRMAPKAISEQSTPEQVVALMATLENNWYEVSVVESSGNDGKVWVNVDDCLIRPANPEVCPKLSPLEFFKNFKPKPKVEVEIKLEQAKADDSETDNIPF